MFLVNKMAVLGYWGGMSQQVKVLATKPDKLSLVPGTHKVEEEKLLPKLSSDLHKHAVGIQAHTVK